MRRRVALAALRGLRRPPEAPGRAAATDASPPGPADIRPSAPPNVFRTSGYGLVPVAFRKEPYRRRRPKPLDGSVNPDGSPPFYVNGLDHPHPTALETHALHMAESYRLTGDPEYLRRAVGTTDKLLAHAVSLDGGLYLAYTFPFEVFGDPRDHLAAPWFSGMAQGRALLVLQRLFEATGEDRWLHAQDRVYATTFHARRAGRPWSTFVDDDGYLWFEEYPGARVPTRVLNGHMSALFGYWERARSTGDPQAQALFDGGATTALHYGELLRRPGEISAYSVRKPRQSGKYHRLHIKQLHQLAVLTGDDAFERLAVAYEADRER